MIINNTKNIYPRIQDSNIRIKTCIANKIDNITFRKYLFIILYAQS